MSLEVSVYSVLEVLYVEYHSMWVVYLKGKHDKGSDFLKVKAQIVYFYNTAGPWAFCGCEVIWLMSKCLLFSYSRVLRLS